MRGWWISLEGADGSGKTALTKTLSQVCERIRRPHVTCIEPGGTQLGASIREILLNGRDDKMCAQSELLLFMASRAELMNKVVRPALNENKIVISDRSVLSTIVYQGYAAQLDESGINVVRGIGNYATGGLFPDLTLVLDCPVDVGLQRREMGRTKPADRIESRGREYLNRVRQGYQTESFRHPKTIMISAHKPLAYMEEHVTDLFLNWLREAERPVVA